MATSASALASTIISHAIEANGASQRAEELAKRLSSDDGFTAAYAFDHAEEELGWIVTELEEAARRLRALQAYTVTGEKRAARESALAAASV